MAVFCSGSKLLSVKDIANAAQVRWVWSNYRKAYFFFYKTNNASWNIEAQI